MSYLCNALLVSWQEEVDEGGYIFDADAAVGIHVGLIVASGIACQEEVNEVGDVVDTELAIIINIAWEIFTIGIEPHVHRLPVIIGVLEHVEQSYIKVTVFHSIPSPVNMDKSILVITVDDEIMPRYDSLYNVDVLGWIKDWVAWYQQVLMLSPWQLAQQ